MQNSNSPPTDAVPPTKITNELRDCNRQFQLVFESTTDGMALQAADGRIIHFNHQAAAILGLTEDQLLGRTSLDPRWHAVREDGSMFPGEEHPAMVTIKTGVPQHSVTMGIRTPDGLTRWLKVSATPFQGEINGQVACVLVTFTDFTTQFNQYRQLAGVVKNSPGMIYQFCMRTDGSMYFSFVSPTAYDIYEITPKDFEKDPALMISMAHPDDQTGLMTAIQHSAATMAPFNWKGRIISRLGKHKWISAKSLPQKDSLGTISWDGLITDITRDIEMQEALSFERAKAAQAAKLASLGEMSAGLAHEINNPLAIIDGGLSLLSRFKDDPEKFAAKLEGIKKATHRIARIVLSLKKFSRSSEKLEMNYLNINNIIDETMILVQAKAKKHDTIMSAECAATTPIYCDEVEIEQVLINLIGNAIDAAKDQSERWVRVSATEDAQTVILRVTDSGPGIPKKIRDQIFEPFFTTKKVGEGTGLGLSISKGILDEHKATIAVLENEPNTCFEIRFPKPELT